MNLHGATGRGLRGRTRCFQMGSDIDAIGKTRRHRNDRGIGLEALLCGDDTDTRWAAVDRRNRPFEPHVETVGEAFANLVCTACDPVLLGAALESVQVSNAS